MVFEGKELGDIKIEDIQYLIDNQIKKNLEDFLEERREKVIDRKGPILFISATPRIVKDDRIDIFDSGLRKLLENLPRLERGSFDLNCSGRDSPGWRPTLYGIKAEIKDWKSLEVLRNGHTEFIASDLLRPNKAKRDNTEYRVFHGLEIIEYLVGFMLFLKELLVCTSISEPMVISLALLNSENIGMSKLGTEKTLSDPRTKVHKWTEGSHLILPSKQISSIDDPFDIAKVFTDRIWNAFGFEKAPFFDEKGNFLPSI